MRAPGALGGVRPLHARDWRRRLGLLAFYLTF